ncbi:MAG: hypothetical protein IKS34_01140 [Clostridia bacterium]|nr:hypothetical protein [Clostridia bacterium]
MFRQVSSASAFPPSMLSRTATSVSDVWSCCFTVRRPVFAVCRQEICFIVSRPV